MKAETTNALDVNSEPSKASETELSPVNWRHTLELWTFAMLKVPLLMFTRPRVRTVCSDRYELSIDLARRTKNPYGSMYFGAMAVGAEATPMAHALVIARSMGKTAFFTTKRVAVQFLAPAKAEVTFRSDDGDNVHAALLQAMEDNRAAPAQVRVAALCADRPVALFDFELALKIIGSTAAVRLQRFAEG